MRAFLLAILSTGCAKAPVLGAVNFDSGTTHITNPSDERYIDEAAEILNSTHWSVIVVGLADAEGDPNANKDLSIARAESVAAQLRAKTEIDDARIVVHGIGERLATGESLKERKVEFVFFKDKGQPVREVVLDSGVLSADIRRKRQAEKN
jgi:outer membrane protein OmpA-like peptidoglycan-associated protein